MKRKREPELGDLLSGTLDIFGLRIDLGELLGSPEALKGRLEELRERLKAAGGKEVLANEEWRQGGVTVTGHIRTRGLLGDREFHVGTTGRPARKGTGQSPPGPTEVAEPPVDVFYEEG